MLHHLDLPLAPTTVSTLRDSFKVVWKHGSCCSGSSDSSFPLSTNDTASSTPGSVGIELRTLYPGWDGIALHGAAVTAAVTFSPTADGKGRGLGDSGDTYSYVRSKGLWCVGVDLITVLSACISLMNA
jgi:hypothetical protein